MSNNLVILLLGTNLNNRNQNLEQAKNYIEKEVGKIEDFSAIIETEPDGFVSENKFLNQTLSVRTSLSPLQLLKTIKGIEQKMGRVYLPTSQKYQDRIIDIDILKYNAITFKTEELKIPHHQILTRNFVKKILK